MRICSTTSPSGTSRTGRMRAIANGSSRVCTPARSSTAGTCRRNSIATASRSGCAANSERPMNEPILDAVERFLEREVRPHVRELEANDTWPAEIVEKMRAMGLFGCVIEERYGGLGLSASTYANLIERISELWMSLAGIINSHLIMASLVQRAGSEEQKRKWLPRFASGELRGGLALTEPDCGTDLRAIRTRARRDHGGYVVNGTKTWISNGIHGHVVALLAKTEGEALSCFICEKGPGFTASRKLEKLGYKGIDSAELVFADHRLPAENLIGGEESRGLQQVLA